jgi:hypothetical protein
MAVVAIGGDHIVLFPEDPDRAHRDWLLAAVLVEESPDLVSSVQLLRPILEAADQHHLAKPDQCLGPVDDQFGLGLHLRHNHHDS